MKKQNAEEILGYYSNLAREQPLSFKDLTSPDEVKGQLKEACKFLSPSKAKEARRLIDKIG